VLFASAIEVIHTLVAATHAGRLKLARRQSSTPAGLMLDALGSLPSDTAGAARLCQVLSLRDAPGALLLTSKRAFQEWPTIFHNARPLTAAMLDRWLPHADTGLIEGQSLRMQGQIET
jgi:DNA replication protein DnaC